MKIRKNYSVLALIFLIALNICAFLIITDSRVAFIVAGITDLGFLLGMAPFLGYGKGNTLKRRDLKEHIKFHLEKISGPGNERFYFIYEGKEKLLYTDTPEFKDGIYVKDGDELLAEKDYVPRLPG